MTPSTCSFCAHRNPAGAKFCNECASPLQLKPCRRCDAVNARDANACYRCDAVLEPAASIPDTSPERIVAEADEMLAALARELVPVPVPETMTPRAGLPAAPVEAPMAPTAFERVTGAGATPAGPSSEARRAAMDEAIGRMSATLPEPTFDANRNATLPEDPPAVRAAPGDRDPRPKRRSRALAIAAGVVLVAVSAAAYVLQDPAQVERWLGRVPAGPADAPAIDATTTAASPVVSPASTPPAPPPADSVPAVSPGESAAVGAQPATGSAPGADLKPLLPAEVAAPAEAAPQAPAPPLATTLPPAREAKAAPSRAKGSAAKSRSRERASKPRPPAPSAQSQRRTPSPQAPASAPAPGTEPCTEAMAALGLCSR